MKNEITNLFNTPMDRGAFLKHIGLAAVLFLGINNLIQVLGRGQVTSQNVSGYGATDYGR
ncbi:MAG: hypothetical protein ABIQ64_04595 [Candidatus Saccharimonadales bacterium]